MKISKVADSEVLRVLVAEGVLPPEFNESDVIGALSYAIQHVKAADWQGALKAIDKAQLLIQDRLTQQALEDLEVEEAESFEEEPIADESPDEDWQMRRWIDRTP